MQFEKGTSGNHRGRPIGTRNRFSNAWHEDVANSWERHGAAVLDRLAVEDPLGYANVCQRTLPKEVAVTIEQRIPGDLSADEWAQLCGLLDTVKRLGGDGSPAEIAERIEHALRAEFAKPLPELEILPSPLPPLPY